MSGKWYEAWVPKLDTLGPLGIEWSHDRRLVVLYLPDPVGFGGGRGPGLYMWDGLPGPRPTIMLHRYSVAMIDAGPAPRVPATHRRAPTQADVQHALRWLVGLEESPVREVGGA